LDVAPGDGHYQLYSVMLFYGSRSKPDCDELVVFSPDAYRGTRDKINAVLLRSQRLETSKYIRQLHM